MSFIKSLFNKKEEPINSYADFWNWFQNNEKKFHNVIKNQGNINKVFFEKLSPKLAELKDGFWFLVGMSDEHTAEIIFTADGVIKNIVFVEELVEAAPTIKNWKITALKQPSDISQYNIEMEGIKFNEKKMKFYPIEHNSMPDKIDIVITHEDLTEENRALITNGIYLALDNTLGELNSISTIDNLNIISLKDSTQELIPLEKLKSFLKWRKKEFIEKYKGLRHDTDQDVYSTLETTLNNGLPLIAVMNTALLNWDSKASHPWISEIGLKYDGSNNNGMPDSATYELLNTIEDEIIAKLQDSKGHINIGRQTADSIREIYFASIDFRLPSKILHEIQKKYQDQVAFKFDIYKDKYWQSFERFIPKQ